MLNFVFCWGVGTQCTQYENEKLGSSITSIKLVSECQKSFSLMVPCVSKCLFLKDGDSQALRQKATLVFLSNTKDHHHLVAQMAEQQTLFHGINEFALPWCVTLNDTAIHRESYKTAMKPHTCFKISKHEIWKKKDWIKSKACLLQRINKKKFCLGVSRHDLLR